MRRVRQSQLYITQRLRAAKSYNHLLLALSDPTLHLALTLSLSASVDLCIRWHSLGVLSYSPTRYTSRYRAPSPWRSLFPWFVHWSRRMPNCPPLLRMMVWHWSVSCYSSCGWRSRVSCSRIVYQFLLVRYAVAVLKAKKQFILHEIFDRKAQVSQS